MIDTDLIYPGTLTHLLYKFLGDPQGIYGGNLLGTYKISETLSVPAITIQRRPPNVLEFSGIEVIVQEAPREIKMDLDRGDTVRYDLVWGFYIVNKTNSYELLSRVLHRLLSVFGIDEGYLLNGTDRVEEAGQFFYQIRVCIDLDAIPNDFDRCEYTREDIPCLPNLPINPEYYEGIQWARS